MSAAQKGLGRGLGALFLDEPVKTAPGIASEKVAIQELMPNMNQPRKDFDPDALRELADSIREQGLIQPILVRPVDGASAKYEIVAGERRWRASQLAGLTEVSITIRELTDQQALALALIENLQREDLNPLEEAWGMQRLKEEFGLSQDEVARQLGKSRSAVANSLRLLNLSQNAQQNLREGRISAGHARALLAFDSPEQQEVARKRVIDEKLSVREVEAMAFAAKDAGKRAGAAIDSPVARSGGGKGKRVVVRLGKKPQSVILSDLQARVAEAVNLPVKISGKESKGRINISYSSKVELQALLKALGVEGGAL